MDIQNQSNQKNLQKSKNYHNIVTQKLKLNNINELFFAQDEDLATLENLTKLDRLGIEQAIFDINEEYSGGFKNAYEEYDEYNSQYLSTGIRDQRGNLFIDDILQGGIGCDDIVEITGQEHSGKTMFIYRLIDQFIKQNVNNNNMIYLIDSGASINMDIIEKKFGYSSSQQKQKLLEKTKKLESKDPEELMVVLCYIENLVKNKKCSIKYIIIDSLTQIFGQDLEFDTYKKFISELQKKMSEISKLYHIGFIVTTNMNEYQQQHNINKKSEFQKQLRPKSLMKSPWNFTPTKTLMLQRTIYEADISRKKCLQTYTILENQTLNPMEVDYRQLHEEY